MADAWITKKRKGQWWIEYPDLMRAADRRAVDGAAIKGPYASLKVARTARDEMNRIQAVQDALKEETNAR